MSDNKEFKEDPWLPQDSILERIFKIEFNNPITSDWGDKIHHYKMNQKYNSGLESNNILDLSQYLGQQLVKS